jgi:hypothetical protein
MKILAAIVLGYFLVVGRVAENGGDAGRSAQVQTGMTAAARTELDRALSISLAHQPGPFDAHLDSEKRSVAPGSRVISLPAGCRSVSEPFDLLVHFHGAPPAMEAAFERSEIDGALVIYNWGIGSDAYDKPFADPRSFDRMLVSITTAIRELCPTASQKLKRIGLSGWSAGYGAIYRIIDRVQDAARVDAVLLADGLHTGFEPQGKREVNAAAMAPFSLYADEAVAGHKLFAITHSSIQTPYASTTETADFLLQTQDVKRTKVRTPGPRPGMLMTSQADREGFHVRGFTGEDKAAHGDHLHAFGDLLLPFLRDRWSKP